MTTLNGARILVTRPAHQAENLCRLIEKHGGSAVRFPTVATVACDDISAIQKKLCDLTAFDYLIFISSNAVNFALKANNGKIARPKTLHIAAIGKATCDALSLAGLSVDVIPSQNYHSEALLALPEMQTVQGLRVLIVRGEGGREELANTLASRGADVQYLNVYKRIVPNIDNSEVRRLLDSHQLAICTVSSGAVVQNLLTMLDASYHQQLFALPLVVLSDRIKQIALTLGFQSVFVANSPADDAVLEIIINRILTGE